MNKLFLKFVTFLNPVLEKTGVDTDQLYQILKVKLLMDDRRPRALFTKKGSTDKPATSNQWLISTMTVLFGFFIGLTLFLNKMPYLGQTLYFVIFMVMMALTLITDFTSVLIDTRDQFIILPRPVNDRTVAVSRILHISLYVLKIALLQALPGLIFVGFIDGILAVPLFFIQIIEATFISIFLVNVTYLIMMQAVSPQKFKDIITYIQIVFSVFVFASYQIFPRLIDGAAIKNISIISHWWSYLLPPVWIAALNETLIHGSRSNMTTALLAITGLVLPVVGLWFVAKVLAPGFNKRLTIIATSEGSSDSAKNIKKAGKFSLINKLANLIAPKPLENAGFRITWKLCARTRDFKMRVYPTFAYMLIYFVMIFLNGKEGSLADRLTALQNGKTYIILIYMSIVPLMAILTNMSQSEKYKSSWIYYALPIDQPGKILGGMYKAVILLYYVPYVLILSTVIVAFWGPSVINDIILAFLTALVYGMLLALFLVKGLPFSKPVINKQSGGKTLSTIMIMGFIGIIGFGHYLIVKWETVVWLMLIPALIVVIVMFHYYKKQTWDNIELSEV